MAGEAVYRRTSLLDVVMRPASAQDVARFAPQARADGVDLAPSDAARPTSWWVAETPRGRLLGICGMMPVEGCGQRLCGAWVGPPWRRMGVWWTMVEFRMEEARACGAEWVETYAVHPGPLLRRGWVVESAEHRNGAVHVALQLGGPDA